MKEESEGRLRESLSLSLALSLLSLTSGIGVLPRARYSAFN